MADTTKTLKNLPTKSLGHPKPLLPRNKILVPKPPPQGKGK